MLLPVAEPGSPSSTSSGSARGSRGSPTAARLIAAFGRTLPSPKHGDGEERTPFGAGPRPDPVAARAMARRARRAASLETAVLRRRAAGTSAADALAGDEDSTATGGRLRRHRRTSSSGSVTDEGRAGRSTSLRERFTTPLHEDASSALEPLLPLGRPTLHWSRRPAVMAKRPSAAVAARSPVISLGIGDDPLTEGGKRMPPRDMTGQNGMADIPEQTAAADAPQKVAEHGSNETNGHVGSELPQANGIHNSGGHASRSATAVQPAANAGLPAIGEGPKDTVGSIDPTRQPMPPSEAVTPATVPAVQPATAARKVAGDHIQSLLLSVPVSTAAYTAAGPAMAKAAVREARAAAPLRRHTSLPAAETRSSPRPEWQEVGMSKGVVWGLMKP